MKTHIKNRTTRMIGRILGFVMLASPVSVLAQSQPHEIKEFLSHNIKIYQQLTTLSPQAIYCDIDGDGVKDCAIALKNAKGEQGLLFFLSKTKKVILIGAGKEFNEWTDLGFTTWSIHPRRKKVQTGVEAGRPPRLLGDAILLEWDESGSGLVYWDGKKIQWYQQGD